MNYSALIQKQEALVVSDKKYNKTLNVVYCIDNNYSLGAGVSIVSLLEHNKNINVSLRLFVMSLAVDNRQRFLDIARQYDNCSLTIYYVSNEFNVNELNKRDYPLSVSLCQSI